ncbi:MAG: cyclase family protein [Alphaproteobacteria bacterium]
MTKRWRRRPEGANWGDFGADDQIGRLNLLTGDRVVRAAKEIRVGKRFCLSLPLDYPGGRVLAPHREPPVIEPSTRHGRSYFNLPFSHEDPACGDCGSDDRVSLSTQYSTQWDGLAHIGMQADVDGSGETRPVYYNGFGPADGVLPPAERGSAPMPLGVDVMAETGLQGRGVLVDLEKHLGMERRHVGGADLLRIMAADGIEVEEGDILCLRTGFARVVLEQEKTPDAETLNNACAVLDGADQPLLDWITRSGIAAIAADNFAVEGIPSRERERTGSFVPLHVHCLFKLGIPLGELWTFEALAPWLRANDRHRFFLTAPPLRLPGAIGSPVTPVATV